MSEGVDHFEVGEQVLTVHRSWCKGCNLCVVACPSAVLALDEGERVIVSDIARCLFCGICAERCPDFVFTLEHRAVVSALGGRV